jgi:hypothetical protein
MERFLSTEDTVSQDEISVSRELEDYMKYSSEWFGQELVYVENIPRALIKAFYRGSAPYDSEPSLYFVVPLHESSSISPTELCILGRCTSKVFLLAIMSDPVQLCKPLFYKLTYDPMI